MAFDGIVTKAIASELQQLSGARVDKIFQPNSNNVIIGCYINGKNYALNICTNSNNYRIHLTTHPKPNPQIAPNFCMVLRKHLTGLHIKNIITANLERIITIEFEGFDEVDDIINKKLIIELMGKHCNIILLNEENIIIDSLRHINNSDSTHVVIPHTKYTYPSTEKLNFLNCNDFEDFKKHLSNVDTESLPWCISNTFNGISKKFINFIISDLNIKDLKEIFYYLKQIIQDTDSLNLKFKTINNDYFLVQNPNNNELFSLNFFIDDFYFNKESNEQFKNYRNTLLKLILDALKKYKKRLYNIDEKLKECEDMDKYRLYGELITSNLYRIPNKNVDKVELENYYDNNAKITINLDKRFLPSINAKRFFKKYSKLKNALVIVSEQKADTLKELDYIESVVYELENCSTIEEVAAIYEEISENEIFKDKTSSKLNKKNSKVKKSKLTKNKTVSFNPIKYTIDGYTVFVGRNNKENDYLTLKFANKNDLWFHTKDIHGSHTILRIDTSKPLPDNDILVKVAKIAALHSKAKNSSNVPVDYCEVRFVKKPSGSKPGMVIYTNNRTLNVTP